MKRVIIASMLLVGCGHANMEKGVTLVQKGLAVVDVGTDKLADEYVEAVQELRAHCAGDEACERKYKVTDEDVRKVTGLAIKLGVVYDTTTAAVETASDVYGEMLPLVKSAKAHAEALR